MPGPIQTYNASLLIDEMIGSAYPTVKNVAQNIEYVKHVSKNLETIYNLSENMAYIVAATSKATEAATSAAAALVSENAAAKSAELASDKLIATSGYAIPITLFKTANNTWGQAWNEWLIYISDHGERGTLPPGEINITGAITFNVINRIHIEGCGSDLTTLIGTNVPTLFNIVSAGITFKGVRTERMQLIGSEAFTTDVDRIEIIDWTYENTIQKSLYIFNRWSDNGKIINLLILDGIYGEGGLCAPQFITAISRGFIDNIEIRNVNVPNDDIYFIDDYMPSGGYNGIILGDDNSEINNEQNYLMIGRIAVDGLRDNRIPKSIGADYIANCQGVRICGGNVSFGSITVRNVSSYYKIDTCGLYHKVTTLRGAILILENAGNGQASWTCKGYTANDTSIGDNVSHGYNVSVSTVSIINTEGFSVGRPAVWLGVEDVYIGDLYVQGCSGEVEDPMNPGFRINGQGSIIYCSEATISPENHPRSRLSFGNLRLVDCVLGAQNSGNVQAIIVNGYKNVYFQNIEIYNLSNSGLLSNQVAGNERPIYMIDWRPNNTIGADRLTIDRMVTRGTINNGKNANAFIYSGSSTAKELRIRNMNVDSGVTRAIDIIGSVALDFIQIEDCDFSALSSQPISIAGSAAPVKLIIRNNRGLYQTVSAYAGTGTIATMSIVTTTVTMNSIASGDQIKVFYSLPLKGIILTAWVSSFQTVTVQFFNPKGTSDSLGAGNITLYAEKMIL